MKSKMKSKPSISIILFTKWLATFGAFLQSAALPIIIFKLTGSSSLLSITFFVETLPWLFFAPLFSNIITSHFSSKQAYIACCVLKGILTFFLGLLINRYICVILIFFLLGILNSMTAPIYSTLLKTNSNEGTLSNILGISLGVDDLVSIVAPLIVSILLSNGCHAVLFIYGNSVILLLTGVLSIRLPVESQQVNLKQKKFHIKESFCKIRVQIGYLSSPRIRYLVLNEFCRSLVEGMCIPLLIVYVASISMDQDRIFTIGETLGAVAQVIMSILYIFLVKKFKSEALINIGAILMCISFIGLTAPGLSSIRFYFISLVFLGMGIAIRQLISENLLISSFEPEILSEVISIYNAVIAFAYLIGYLISSFQTQVSNLSLFFIIGMILLLFPKGVNLLLKGKTKWTQQTKQG